MRNLDYQNYLNRRVPYDEWVWKAYLKKIKNGELSGISIDSKKVVGALEGLPWDTQILDYKTWKVRHLFFEDGLSGDNLLSFNDEFEKFAKYQQIDLMNFRFSSLPPNLVQLLEQKEWYPVDKLNIYFSPLQNLNLDFTIGSPYSITKIDPTQVLKIFDKTPDLFSQARLYQDPHISYAQADTFYKALFVSICESPKSIKIGLFHREDCVGFVIGTVDDFLSSHDFKLGYLWLIALTPSFQNRGLSKILLQAFLKEMRTQVDYLEIGTQEENLAANRLYRSQGFEKVTQATTFHRFFKRL